MGCFNANSQASLSALFTEPMFSFSSDVMLIGTCFQEFVEWIELFGHSGNIISVIFYEAKDTAVKLFLENFSFYKKILNFESLWRYSLA